MAQREQRKVDGNEEEAAADEDSGGDSPKDKYTILPKEVQIVDLIGEGTTSKVFLAIYKEEQVAVKDIRPTVQGGLDMGTLKAVQRELRVLSQAKHPHILNFIGIISDRNGLRLVLEYCSGGSLFDLLHNSWRTQICWEQKFKMLADTASAQAHLHSFNPPILHRDLKSLNLMLKQEITNETDEPQIKLADFGFARAQEQAMTKCVGTKRWMAPEVINTTKYTQKADVFSFAMVAYEVCCRHVPFIDMDVTSAVQEILKGARPDLSDTEVVPAEVPPEMLDLIARCWAHEPTDRPSFDEIHATVLSLSAMPRPTEPLV